MNRHPFANYDSWLEQPYQDAADASDKAEWIAENSRYSTDCCDADVDWDWGRQLKEREAAITRVKPRWPEWTQDEIDSICVKCPTCGELTEITLHEPAEYDGDYDCENGGDGRDD